MQGEDASQTRIVLFDLGGVLIELGGVDHFGQLIGENDESVIWSTWLRSTWVRRYERGFCSRDDFAHGMREEHGLELGAGEFLDLFLSWPRGLFPGAEELVASLAPGVGTACLSNTNELHWNEQQDAPVLHRLFETRFLSHELGLVKPDREIFEHVLEDLDLAGPEVLFLDDNQINVDGALQAGLDAQVVKGVDAVRALLDERGLLAR
jgi:putative hydrolase of the HAD superfamily